MANVTYKVRWKNKNDRQGYHDKALKIEASTKASAINKVKAKLGKVYIKDNGSYGFTAECLSIWGKKE
jgi:hypothetical protein